VIGVTFGCVANLADREEVLPLESALWIGFSRDVVLDLWICLRPKTAFAKGALPPSQSEERFY
jgi:hypothetical protein